jgi:hypothetical protein
MWRGCSVHVEGGTRVQLELLHLTQSVGRVVLRRTLPVLIAPANFDSRSRKDDGKVRKFEGCQDLMTNFTHFWCHVNGVATEVCPRGVLNQQSSGVCARLIPVNDQVVEILLLKVEPFVRCWLMMLQLHVITQLFQFPENSANAHKVRTSKDDIPAFGVL